MFTPRQPLTSVIGATLGKDNSVPSTADRQSQGQAEKKYLPAKLRYKRKNLTASSSPFRPAISSSSISSSSPLRHDFQFSSPATSLNGDVYACTTSTSPPPPFVLPPEAGKLSISSHLDAGTPLSTPNNVLNTVEITSERHHFMPLHAGEVLHMGRKLNSSSLTSKIQHGTLVRLPKAAKHASRHHCSIQLYTSTYEQGQMHGSMELHLDVMGQNGMLLQGKKAEMGLRTLTVTNGQDINLGFFCDIQVTLRICCPSKMIRSIDDNSPITTESEAQQEEVALTSETTYLSSDADVSMHSESDLMPPSPAASRQPSASMSISSSPLSVIASPPKPAAARMNTKPEATADEHATDHRTRQENSDRRVDPDGKVNKRQKRVHVGDVEEPGQKPSPYAHQDDDGYPPESSSDEEDETDESEEAQTNRDKLETDFAAIRIAISDHSIDTVGTLSTALVFQPRATLPTSECVSLFLETSPTLITYGSLQAWRYHILCALQSGPFGCVDNAGLKDAAGKALEASWHYVPTLDADKERKASLSPFVKSVRTTQRERKQYFYKRPSDLSKRKRW